MLRRVKIVSVPKARTGYQVQGALVNDVPAMGGKDYNAYIGQKDPKVRKNLTAVPREEANLEAEGGETVIGNIDGSTMPSFYNIQGPRHTNGGVPLNLPDDSFIFSDTASMKITDPVILKMFNKTPKKGGYTPAELSKQFDINTYRKTLQDPESDAIARKTAELMIKNYTIKLGALALAQEAKKGFPQGIPVIAQPYMESNGITEEDVMPELAMQKREQEQMMQQAAGQEPNIEPEAQEDMATMYPGMSPDQMQMMPEEEMPMAAYGMEMGGYGIPFYSDTVNSMRYGGISKLPALPKAQSGLEITQADLTEEDWNNIRTKWNNKTQAYIDYLNQRKALLADEDLLNDVYTKYKELIEQESSYTKGNKQLYEGYAPELRKLDKQAVAEALLAQEERNARLKAFGLDVAKGENFVDPNNPNSRTNAYTNEFIKNTPGLQDLDFRGGYKGQAAYLAYDKVVRSPKYKDQFGEFQTGKDDEQFGDITAIDDVNVNTTEGMFLRQRQCTCINPQTGNRYAVVRNADGTCPPCSKTTTKCQCYKDDGTPYFVEKNADGTCPDCENTVSDIQSPPKPPASYWLQDVIGTMGAAQNLASLKKYMPWEARVDLEEPRPRFYDPTRELAANSEMANIATQGAAQFATPQDYAARAMAIQGQGAKQAADTLSRYNNLNVGLANQFEQLGTGIRNQESMANQQMANRVYDKNVIANQQFDNAVRQGRNDLRTAYSNAITNKYKTDALNQLYPNYQTTPWTGGKVDYYPTEKTVDPGVEGTTYGEELRNYINAGFSEDAAEKMILEKYKADLKTGKKGGSMPGYIYTDWPIFI